MSLHVFWAVAPKGTKSCRTQDSKPGRADLRPGRAGFRPERTDFRPERARGANGWMDRRINERPRVLQDFVPFGAAALLSLTPIYNHAY